MLATITAAEASYLRAIEQRGEIGQAADHPPRARQCRARRRRTTRNKRYDLAVQRFEQAIGMSRRHEGLLNKQQVPLLEKYADSLTQLGRYQDALQAQKYILRVETRGYGENDPAHRAGAGAHSAAGTQRVGAYDQSRRTLKKATRDRGRVPKASDHRH